MLIIIHNLIASTQNKKKYLNINFTHNTEPIIDLMQYLKEKNFKKKSFKKKLTLINDL